MKFIEEKRVQEGIIIKKHHYSYKEGWIYSTDLNKDNTKKIDKSFYQLTKELKTARLGKEIITPAGTYVHKTLGSIVEYEKDRKIEVCFAGGKIVGSKEKIKRILEKIIEELED